MPRLLEFLVTGIFLILVIIVGCWILNKTEKAAERIPTWMTPGRCVAVMVVTGTIVIVFAMLQS